MDFIPKKKLGFGLMRLPLSDPNNSMNVDLDLTKKMVDVFMQKGFSYFDSAWFYHDGASESVAKKALVERYPRDSFTFATKLHCIVFKTKKEREACFCEQLKKTGVQYFDYYLLHGVNEEYLQKYENLECFEYLQEKKKQGLVRHIGFSYHDGPELLDRILTKYPYMEFVQLQLNYLDWESDNVQARRCYEVAEKHCKPVIVMEPVKGGTLAKIPKEAETLFRQASPYASVSSWAIRFAASLPNVMTVLSGMSDLDQMLDNTSFMENFIPLTEEEKQLCFKAAEIINAKTAIPCTGCEYCTSGCPLNIAIPKYFSLYNEDMREDLEAKEWTFTNDMYRSVARHFGKAGDCIACGQCEAACPQHLPIIDYLKTVAKHYESD